MLFLLQSLPAADLTVHLLGPAATATAAAYFLLLFFRAGRGFCPPSSRQQIASSVLREKRLEGFQGVTVPPYAQTSPQWCTDHCADAPNH